MSDLMQQVVPEGYKLTEVGVIPEDWSASTVGENTYWSSGGTPNRKRADYWEGNIPWISGSTLKKLEISTSDQFLTPEGVAAGSNMAPVNATLLLVRGSALHNHIRVGLVVSPVAFNQDVKALVPRESVFPKYLTFYMKGMESELLKLVSSAGNSAGVLDTELVKGFRFLRPKLEEQIQIANALNDVDTLITSLEKLIAKKRAIKTASMQQLLTGKKRLPPFDKSHTGYKQTELGVIPEDWVVRSIGDFAPLQRGFDLPNRDRVNGLYPVVYSNGIVNYHNMFQVRGPGVVTGRSGTIGKVHYIEEDFWPHNTSLWVTKFNNTVPKYIYYLYESIGFSRFSSGSGVPTLNRNDAHSYLAAMPLQKEEQSSIANALADMDSEINGLNQRLDKTQKVKQGMMQELLTGKTRLIANTA